MATGNILLNETIKIRKESEEEWLQWIESHYLPIFLDSGLILAYQLNRVITQDDDGITYALQLELSDMANVHKLHLEHLQKAQQSLQNKFKDKYVIFRTLMEIVKSSEK